VMTFLYWGLTSQTAQKRVSDLGFVPLPDSTLDLIRDVLTQVVCDGQIVLSQLAIGCDGIIGSGLVYDACGVCDGNNSTCCLGTPEQIATYCFPCDFAPGYPPYILNTYNCDGFIDCKNGDDDFHCRISIIRTSISLSAIAGVLLILTVIVAIDIFIHREERLFRESNVLFMMMILAGCVVGYATVFVLSQLSKLNDFVCGVQYWFFCVAFVLTFGAMIAKTYQVYMLHRQNSGDMSAYTNAAIVRYVAGYLLLEIALLIIWTAFDLPKPKLAHNDPDDSTKEHYICGNRYFSVFASLIATSLAAILIAGVVLSFLSRKIDFEGNESRLIRLTIFSAGILAILIVPLLIAFADEYPFAKIILSNLGIMFIVTLVMLIYFGPRLITFHFGDRFKKSKEGNRNRLLGPIDI